MVASALLLRTLSEEFFGLLQRALQAQQRDAALGLALLLYAIYALRLVGLYLKRFPLQARLNWHGERSILGMASFCISGGLAFILVAVAAGSLMQWLETYEDIDETILVAGSIAAFLTILPLAYVEIGLYGRLMKPLGANETQRMATDLRFTPAVEALADAGLFVYLVVWQLLFEAALLLYHKVADLGGFGDFVLNLPIMLVAFLVLYVAPRAPLLMEDGRYRGTWTSMAMVFVEQVSRRVL